LPYPFLGRLLVMDRVTTARREGYERGRQGRGRDSRHRARCQARRLLRCARLLPSIRSRRDRVAPSAMGHAQDELLLRARPTARSHSRSRRGKPELDERPTPAASRRQLAQVEDEFRDWRARSSRPSGPAGRCREVELPDEANDGAGPARSSAGERLLASDTTGAPSSATARLSTPLAV